MRAEKSVVSSAYGPRSRCASLKFDDVDHSTHSRAGRSQRDQTIPRSASTSPLCTPDGKPGREPATTAGA